MIRLDVLYNVLVTPLGHTGTKSGTPSQPELRRSLISMLKSPHIIRGSCRVSCNKWSYLMILKLSSESPMEHQKYVATTTTVTFCNLRYMAANLGRAPVSLPMRSMTSSQTRVLDKCALVATISPPCARAYKKRHKQRHNHRWKA